MDILVPLFANSGLSGAVLASLLGIIYVLLKDRRLEHEQQQKDRLVEHEQRQEVQKETNRILMELSGLIREFQGMTRRGDGR